MIRENPDFRRLWSAELITLGGDWFNAVALLGLVLELSGAAAAGAILAASNLPHVALSPVAGVLADRFDRKRLVVGAALAQAVVALGMLLVRSPGTVWIGIACTALIAGFAAFLYPAQQAALPNLVTPEQLGPANVLMGSAFGTMLAVGSALGGIVAATLGREVAFVANSASFLLSALLMLRIRGRFSERTGPAPPVRPLKDLADGVRFARADRRVVALLATKGGFGMGAGLIVLLSVFATDVFGAGDGGIGLLFGARGLGALIGPFAARALVGNDQRRLFLTIGGSMALFSLAYLMFPAAPGLWVAAPVVVLAHLGGGAQWLMSSYGLQMLTPDEVRGRIFAFDLTLVTLTISVSLLAAGWAAERFDPGTVMLVLAGIDLLYAVAWTLWTRRIWVRPPGPPAVAPGPPFPLEDVPLVGD